MYEFYSKEKLNKLFPILETEANAIINFVSCDGVMGYKLASVLGSLNPDMKYAFQNNCRDGKITKGVILTNKKNLPFIIQLPFKETFKEKADLDYIRSGFEKLETALKDGKIILDTIAIQKGIIEEEMLLMAIKDLKLPEIIFYDEVDPYERSPEIMVEKIEVKNKK